MHIKCGGCVPPIICNRETSCFACRSHAERRAAGLSQREDELLLKFGYPYVMENFLFHMTLTQRIEASDRAQILDGIAPIVEPIADKPLRVDAVALFHQANRDAAFVMVERLSLTG